MTVTDRTDTFSEVAYTHFVPSFFLGVMYLALSQAFFSREVLVNLTNSVVDLSDLVVAVLTGGLVAVTVVGYHLWRDRRHAQWASQAARSRRMAYGALVGFMGGFLDVLIGLREEVVFLLTLVVLAVLIVHLRRFSRQMVRMLRPGNVATWSDVRELLRIYVTMLAGFTLVNATLDGTHVLAGSVQPFGFSADGQLFLNSLYFTVVTMTTLGYGDIVPKTWDGKMLVIFECLASYIMFALMVGIITRGVVDTRDGAE